MFPVPDVCSLSQVGKLSVISSSNKFSVSLSLFSFWDSHNVNASMLDIVPEVP